MANAGSLQTPLLKKLGIKVVYKLLLINKPTNYFDLLEANVSDQLSKKTETPDFIHVFVKNGKEFESEMKKIKKLATENPNVIIWVSWYKKSAGIPTDITEDTIRNYALKNGLVDVKVCAVSDIWSALKLVVPLKLR